MSNSISISNIKIPFPTEGVIRTAQLDDTVSPQDSAQIAVNMNFDRIGAIQTRLGVANYGGTFPITATVDILSMASLQTKGEAESIATYPSSASSTDLPIFAGGSQIAIGEAFTCPILCRLEQCEFFLKKTGNPPSTMTATLYLASHVPGSDAVPIGSILATSDAINASTLTGSLAVTTFTFSGANRVLMQSGFFYVIVINYNNGDGSNCISAGFGNTPSYTGNPCLTSDLITWSDPGSGYDLIFNVLASSSTGRHRLFVQDGNTYIVWDQTSWTNLGSIGSDTKARWAQFLNYIWRVNGTFNSPVQTSNGGAFGTTLVPADFPAADFISAGFEGRVWIADAVNDVIYYTDIVQFTPPNDYSLTFDLDTNFIQNFSPQDGQSFTGLFRVPRALLVFKQNSIYRIYGATSVDAYPAYNVGTYSQESIVQTKDGVYFHHSSGFYQFNYDGQPTEISRRIIDFIQAIPLSKYSTIVGQWDQFDSISWAIGTVIVEGVTYRNCVVRYTISTQVWTIYDYGHKLINSMVIYDDGVSVKKLIGTSSSSITSDVIGQLDSGFTDFGDPIYFEYIDRWRTFADMYAKTQSISGFNLYSENAAGARVEYQIQKQPPNVWGDIGTVNESNMSLFPNCSTDDFEVARLRVSGDTKGTQIVIHGMEILSVNIKGYEQN